MVYMRLGKLIKDLIQFLRSNPAQVVLYGAGDFGQLVLFSLKKHDIQVSYFCDSNVKKQGKIFFKTKTISPHELSKLPLETHIFISNHYVDQVSSLLNEVVKHAGVFSSFSTRAEVRHAGILFS